MRRAPSRVGLLGLAITLAVTAAACGDDDTEAAVPTVSVTVAQGAEYRFAIPDQVEAGAVRLDVENRGTEPHHAQVFRLDDGKTMDDLEAALATAEPAALLEVGTFVGGTGLVSPGEDSGADAVLDLAPGEYALLCLVPDANGTPHVAHGMVRPFTVTAPGGAEVPAPEADAEVTLADYRIDLPDVVDRSATLSITNTAATEVHEMVLTRLDEDASVDDLLASLADGAPLPGVAVGGMQALLPGDTHHLALDLEPGRYAVFCAVPSPDGTPHFARGMAGEITVQ